MGYPISSDKDNEDEDEDEDNETYLHFHKGDEFGNESDKKTVAEILEISDFQTKYHIDLIQSPSNLRSVAEVYIRSIKGNNNNISLILLLLRCFSQKFL